MGVFHASFDHAFFENSFFLIGGIVTLTRCRKVVPGSYSWCVLHHFPDSQLVYPFGCEKKPWYTQQMSFGREFGANALLIQWKLGVPFFQINPCDYQWLALWTHLPETIIFPLDLSCNISTLANSVELSTL